ncbi:MAG TPA: DUF58 domain-containing protein [Bacteroidales bacterium]|nr:MAG: hypothetical protein A2W98_00505 [Bacteroidetes bacterium GWF2_33_38]OFY72336.1 MAG: hypothetical protein A2265_07365 [Bacteroidetes bacterium RIFOXYA12_FULL_33_9]OFY90220.1 MAG: hypothetical protein A2236_02740 [Bacteroidetes bacterium RIFOXYA2_FULL_33_7]HBF88240.1 DUF58 domain-containing protein [Bacteroidales bacterium]
MEATELLKKVRKIEIKTRGLSKHIFAGEYHSAFKGKGMAFSEVREYQYGDDIRSIDWNVTARFNHPYIKVFEEERELTVILLIDLSASKDFGTHVQLKQDLITELAAVLSFSAIQNNDKIGVIFFTDKIEKFIPPKKGKTHILRIIRELLDFKPEKKNTDISGALKYFNNVIKKRSVAFVISDFIDKNFEDALRIANRKHDVVALRTYDKRETELPSMGLIKMKDAESGNETWVDTSDAETRSSYKKWWLDTEKQLNETFKKSGVDYVYLRTDEDYVRPLLNLFKRR